MFEVSTVVVPIDFSSCSLAALEHAAALAAPRQGTVHLLHVVNPAASGLGGVEPVTADVLERFRERLARLADSVRGRGVRTESHVVVGAVDDEVLGLSDRQGADLIVMGTYGRSGWGHLLLGGTTERVVRRAQCPVLTVKERHAADRLDEAAVAVDLPAGR